MKQITEDYCSFEIAKLLKEKGLDEEYCYEYYDKNEELKHCEKIINNAVIDDGFPSEALSVAPTHQMTLKWLREVGIVITIKTHYPSNPELCKIPYSFLIEDYRPERDMKKEHGKYSTGYSSCANMDDFLIENKLLFDGFSFGEFEKYEKAVEAAILYVLKNLI